MIVRKKFMERIDTDTLHFYANMLSWLSLWESCHRR